MRKPVAPIRPVPPRRSSSPCATPTPRTCSGAAQRSNWRCACSQTCLLQASDSPGMRAACIFRLATLCADHKPASLESAVPHGVSITHFKSPKARHVHVCAELRKGPFVVSGWPHDTHCMALRLASRRMLAAIPSARRRAPAKSNAVPAPAFGGTPAHCCPTQAPAAAFCGSPQRR